MDKAPTQKQLDAISNMRRALGSKHGNQPKTIQEASVIIKELKIIINKNLSIGGTINPKHSYLFRNN